MISVEKAVQLISETVQVLETEMISLDKASGRILRENLYADRSFPPFNRVTMDGIALQFSAFEGGQRSFPITGIVAAGAPQMHLQNATHCLEVMTGAILPKGTDTVIRYEDLIIKNGVANLQIEDLKFEKNVHKKGSDRAKGSLLVKKNKLISAAEIAIAATIGKTHLKVSQLPKMVIISTGDELVGIENEPLPHQIRRSNSYMLQGIFAKMGIPADIAHLKDYYDKILFSLKLFLEEYQVIIMSGGVSMGKFDFLPKALKELGVTEYFHKIKQRPGKPLWFGKKPNGAVVFALPGNPVSTFSCAHKYVVPWVNKCLGLEEQSRPFAILQDSFDFKPELTYFLQVKINYNKKGQLLATPINRNGSGDLASLTDADGLLELPAKQSNFKKGECYPIYFYR